MATSKPAVAAKPGKLTMSPSSEALNAALTLLEQQTTPTPASAKAKGKVGAFSYLGGASVAGTALKETPPPNKERERERERERETAPVITLKPVYAAHKKNESELDDDEYQRLKADMDRKARNEAERRETERRKTENAEEALRQLELEQASFMEQFGAPAVLTSPVNETRVSKSLEDIMAHAMKIEDQRLREQQAVEDQKRQFLRDLLETYNAKVQAQSTECKTSSPSLLYPPPPLLLASSIS